MVYPHDVPDVARPLLTAPEITELDVAPLAMSPEWIRSEALHAAVVIVAADRQAGNPMWDLENVFHLADLYADYIKGDE